MIITLVLVFLVCYILSAHGYRTGQCRVGHGGLGCGTIILLAILILMILNRI